MSIEPRYRVVAALAASLALASAACGSKAAGATSAAPASSPGGVSASGSGLGSGSEAAVTLAPGDHAPAFDLPGSDGKSHTLADHAGREAVVIAWFPKAFTGG